MAQPTVAGSLDPQSSAPTVVITDRWDGAFIVQGRQLRFAQAGGGIVTLATLPSVATAAYVVAAEPPRLGVQDAGLLIEGTDNSLSFYSFDVVDAAVGAQVPNNRLQSAEFDQPMQVLQPGERRPVSAEATADGTEQQGEPLPFEISGCSYLPGLVACVDQFFSLDVETGVRTRSGEPPRWTEPTILTVGEITLDVSTSGSIVFAVNAANPSNIVVLADLSRDGAPTDIAVADSTVWIATGSTVLAYQGLAGAVTHGYEAESAVVDLAPVGSGALVITADNAVRYVRLD